MSQPHPTLTAIAIALWEAQECYRKAMYGYIRDLPVLEDDEFWPLVDAYRQEVVSTFQRYPDGNAEIAAHNLVCKLGYRPPEILSGVSDQLTVWQQAIIKVLRFSKTWDSLRGGIHHAKHFNTIFGGRGDDSTSDLLDSFPLFGRQVTEKFLKNYYGSYGALKDAFKDYLDATHPADTITKLLEHITRGENYHHMKMEEKALELFVNAFGQTKEKE